MKQEMSRSLFFRFYPHIFFLITLAVTFDLDNRFTGGVIWSDAEGYYMYLPAVFVNGGFENLPVRTEVQFSTFPGTSRVFTKYTCGVAYLELPFFLVFHFAARLLGIPTGGIHGNVYIFSLLLAGAVYAFLGMIFLRRILRRQFSPAVTLITIASLFFGTNLYYYSIYEPGMSHVYSFFLFALFVYLTPRFYHPGGAGIITGMGLLAGLVVLIRPTNIFLLLYLFFYDVRSRADLRERLLWYRRRLHPLWLSPLAAFVVFIPQFLYWKYISGNWIIYSYGEEGFTYLANPRIREILFEAQNGWLLLTPLAFLFFPGLVLGTARRLYSIPVIALITGIVLYLFASWWMWWFGGAMGYRPMIEFYALLAIPYAYFTTLVWEKGGWWRRGAYLLLIALMTYYNLGLTSYKNKKILSEYNWETWNAALDRMFPVAKVFRPEGPAAQE